MVNVNPGRIHTRHRDIDPEVKLLLVDEERVVNILLDHIPLVVDTRPDLLNRVRYKNSLTLTRARWLTDIEEVALVGIIAF